MAKKRKLRKEIKRKFEFGREVFGKHAYAQAIKLHDEIKHMVLNNYVGKEHSLNWDLKGQVVDIVQKALDTDINLTTAKRWIDKVSGIKISEIDDPVDWGLQKRIDALGVREHQPRILRSTRWIDRYVEKGEGEIAPETFRYIKWANYVLNNMGSALALDIDLWVIAKAFQRREQLGLENQDLIDWISYAPYMSKHYYQEYLDAVNKGTVEQLSAFEFEIQKEALEEALREGAWEKRTGSEFMPGDNYEFNFKFKARATLSEYLFGFGEALDLQRYLLPSQTLAQWISIYGSLIKIELGYPSYIEMDIEKEVRINSTVPSTVPYVTKEGEFVADAINQCV